MKGYYSTWQDATLVSGHYCPSTRMAEYRSLDFNGHLASQHAVNDWPNVMLEMTKLSTMWRPIKYKEVLEPEKVDRTRPVYADRSLHSVRSLSLFHARLSCWCHHTSFMTRLSPCIQSHCLCSIRSCLSFTGLLLYSTNTDRMHRCPRGQRSVTSSDLLRLYFFTDHLVYHLVHMC
jgi:hypothetical protein